MLLRHTSAVATRRGASAVLTEPVRRRMTEASANLSLVLTFANMLLALVLRKVCTEVAP